jgi:hypothetical protein
MDLLMVCVEAALSHQQVLSHFGNVCGVAVGYLQAQNSW